MPSVAVGDTDDDVVVEVCDVDDTEVEELLGRFAPRG